MEEPLVNPNHLKIKPQKKSNTYEKMDVYIVTLRLSRFFEGIYKDFKQVDKYGIAKDMRDYLTNIQTYLMILNDFDNEEKLNIMLKTKIEIAKFGAKLNISKDNKVFKSFKQWNHTAKEYKEICKQCDMLTAYFVRIMGDSKK